MSTTLVRNALLALAKSKSVSRRYSETDKYGFQFLYEILFHETKKLCETDIFREILMFRETESMQNLILYRLANGSGIVISSQIISRNYRFTNRKDGKNVIFSGQKIMFF
jgi:hypothetical protein